MPPIQGTSFKPVSPLSNAEIINLCVPGTGNVAARALQEKKLWDASPTFFFFTHLGSDNKKINSCYLSMLGSWQSDIIVSTHRFCPALDEESFLTIKDLDLSQFRLDENLVSQCIPLSSLEPVINLEGEKVSWEDYVEQGGREMCIRAHVTPTTDHSARLSLMLVPESLEVLNTLSCVAGLVPGFALTSKELAISPAARLPWGLAFVTLLIKGDTTKDVGQIDQLELRRAIHKVLQGSIVIKACRQMESYKKRLEKLKSGEVSDPIATEVWPEAQGATNYNSDHDNDNATSSDEDLSDPGQDQDSILRQVGNDLDLNDSSNCMPKRKALCSGSSATPSAKHHKFSESAEVYYANWDQLELIWPLDERPEGHLRDKKWINSTPLDTILRFYEIYEKKQKDLSSNDSMREDKKPRTVMFEAGEDNYFDCLHPARFLRFPLCTLDDIWKKVPVEIMEKYRNLDLASVGADCQLSEKTIAKMHSRREILQLRYFYSGNAGVSRGPMVETKVKDGKSLGTIADFNWSNISNIKNLQDSIINYGLTKQMLFPYDQTGYLFMKLYNHYNWLQGAGNDLKRINLMQEHFNYVMEANASRASKKQSPFDFDELEKSLKKMLDNKGLPNSPTALFEKSTDIGFQKKVVNSQKSSSNSGFGLNKNKFSSPQSKSRFICYDFNNQGKGCTRSKSAGGCKDANGKEYAHNCLFYDMVKKQYCYGPHSKQNHV